MNPRVRASTRLRASSGRAPRPRALRRYRKYRDAYLRADTEFLQSTGPYVAAKTAYEGAVRTYLDSMRFDEGEELVRLKLVRDIRAGGELSKTALPDGIDLAPFLFAEGGFPVCALASGAAECPVGEYCTGGTGPTAAVCASCAANMVFEARRRSDGEDVYTCHDPSDFSNKVACKLECLRPQDDHNLQWGFLSSGPLDDGGCLTGRDPKTGECPEYRSKYADIDATVVARILADYDATHRAPVTPGSTEQQNAAKKNAPDFSGGRRRLFDLELRHPRGRSSSIPGILPGIYASRPRIHAHATHPRNPASTRVRASSVRAPPSCPPQDYATQYGMARADLMRFSNEYELARGPYLSARNAVITYARPVCFGMDTRDSGGAQFGWVPKTPAHPGRR